MFRGLLMPVWKPGSSDRGRPRPSALVLGHLPDRRFLLPRRGNPRCARLLLGLVVACVALWGCPEKSTVAAEPSITVGGAKIEIAFSGPPLRPSQRRLIDWVRNSACAVVAYYGRFPVSRLHVEIESIDSNRHFIHGRTFVSDGPVISIFASRVTSEDEIRSDWVMTHEMVHLAFPSVSPEHQWIEEGIATYVEPIARVEAGNLDVRTVWHDMVKGLPNGLPRPGDEGLDHTHTWGRTYWGGALFCLLADLEIRERTENRHGLQGALRGIVAAGGSLEVDWPLTRALEVGDEAVGVSVLTQLYERMKAKAVDPNLPAIWRRLGVEVEGSTVVFDDRASLAAVRQAIMPAPSSDQAPCVAGAKSSVF